MKPLRVTVSILVLVFLVIVEAASAQSVDRRVEVGLKPQAVLQAGGEGLMLHRADAPYLTGRSDVLLKLKP